MVGLLLDRGIAKERIHVFSADGDDPAADLATRDVPPADFWLIEGTSLGNRLKPQTRIVDTGWGALPLRAARQAALREWFEAAPKRLARGDQLLVFVTDHGTGDPKDPENNAISLWHEKLTVSEWRALLARLPAGVRVAMVMSQCYSGAFANVIGNGGAAAPAVDVCGFFSTTADQKAYGCYPEGRDRDKIGHAFEFIDALGRRATTAEAHLDVLAGDDTPDVPLRTSDVYLAQLVSARASARGTDPDALVDSLLSQAWRARADWEQQVRVLDRIGTAFGTFSPRSLGEVREREKELDAVAKQISSYTDRWKVALAEAREAVVADFLAARPEWRARLEQGAVGVLSPEDRAALLDELLPRMLERARSLEDLWSKLELFRSHAARGSEAAWRMEVRKAALQRMRTILVGIAGRVLVAGEAKTAPSEGASPVAPSGVLARLLRCEAFQPGAPPDPGMATEPRAAAFPSVSAELAILEEISPSWLGVRFRPVAATVRTAHGLPAGANLLDAVYSDSPAQEAGLAVGDVVVGPPGRPFESPRELREWTLTSPRGVPLPLVVFRPGEPGQEAQQFEASLVLRVAPVDLPKLPSPPLVGERAPALPPALRLVGSSGLPELRGQPHLLFFWATWCAPCKAAVPEVLALARSRGVPVLAISDEDEATVARFLAEHGESFIPTVAVDPLRRSFISYGVSGRPTLLLVDGEGVIRHRQVGYNAAQGLTVEGWSRPAR